MKKIIFVTALFLTANFCTAAETPLVEQMEQAISQGNLETLKNMIKLFELNTSSQERLPVYTHLLAKTYEFAIKNENPALLNSPVLITTLVAIFGVSYFMPCLGLSKFTNLSLTSLFLMGIYLISKAQAGQTSSSKKGFQEITELLEQKVEAHKKH